MQNNPVTHCITAQRASNLSDHLSTPALINLCMMFSPSKFGTLSPVLVSTTTILTRPFSSEVAERLGVPQASER